MPRRFSPVLLRLLRNQIPINTLIITVLKVPTKNSDNCLRFLCPICGDFHTATNSKTNLARCFRCQKNFNPIDMVMTVNNCSFVEAVRFLEPFLLSQSSNAKARTGQENKHRPEKVSNAKVHRLGGVRLKDKVGREKSSCVTSCERKVPFIRA